MMGFWLKMIGNGFFTFPFPYCLSLCILSFILFMDRVVWNKRFDSLQFPYGQFPFLPIPIPTCAINSHSHGITNGNGNSIPMIISTFWLPSAVSSGLKTARWAIDVSKNSKNAASETTRCKATENSRLHYVSQNKKCNFGKKIKFKNLQNSWLILGNYSQ